MKFKHVIAIVSDEDDERAQEIMYFHNAQVLTVVSAIGSAKSEIMDMLGFEVNEKALIVGIVAQENEATLLSALYRELLSERGKGIALTVNIDGYIGLKSLFAPQV